MFEIEVRHPGLKTFRVVRARSLYECQEKAKALSALWNERWQRKHQAEQMSSLRERNRELARLRTEDSQRAIAEISEILIKGVACAGSLDWDDLKDTSAFNVPPPPEPRSPFLPDEPNPGLFVVSTSFLDGLLPARRRRREAERDTRLRRAREEWAQQRNSLESHFRSECESYLLAKQKWESEKATFAKSQRVFNDRIEKIRTRYFANDPGAVEFFFKKVIDSSDYPLDFSREATLEFNPESEVLIVDFKLPTRAELPVTKEVRFVQSRAEFVEIELSEGEHNRLYESALYQIALRTLYEVFRADDDVTVKAAVFNGWVETIDKATGQAIRPCIISFHANREEFLAVDFSKVDPKTCFKKLKGVGSSKLSDLTPIQPILRMSREDKRFITSRSVVNQIDNGQNLASMEWEDFEQLIREIFEKEFSASGGEVKITRASRDAGVDAIAFDPDPIRGGKVVIQAKRYTATVGVSAVRDLYGTVLNEGANKGILVTTADYGPDSYDFAKGKPLTLMNGSELLYLLARHGHQATIDLRDARRLAALQEKGSGNRAR